jgi:hypothetical protein
MGLKQAVRRRAVPLGCDCYSVNSYPEIDDVSYNSLRDVKDFWKN